MWQVGWRDSVWSQLDQDWDLIIVGGGITGAGIFREAVRSGVKVLLVEADDFASGTSSRSSKLVHGGFRYLKNLQFKITVESVEERERLLREGKGLINPLDILFTGFDGDKIPQWAMGFGIILYGLLARKWQYHHLTPHDLRRLCPQLTAPDLKGGFLYYDAQTDDARLTLRLIREAVQQGGVALNYARVIDLLRRNDGTVCGVVVQEEAGKQSSRTAEVKARLVINATGPWTDELRRLINRQARIRPLRGSHLLFPRARLPLDYSVSMFHPRDGRSVFTFPWEGVTLVGTTDVDVEDPVCTDPSITQWEAEYLLEFVQKVFPEQGLTLNDVVSTWAGIRPVINTGKVNPSEESREHAIWFEDGMLTVTGGKLTTFRVMARDVLQVAQRILPELRPFDSHARVLAGTVLADDFLNLGLSPEKVVRLLGRYGLETPALLDAIRPDEIAPIPGTPYLWGELRWAARAEGVLHLDDLLLRRVRIGLLLPDGAQSCLPRVKQIIMEEQGWNEEHWYEEVEAYQTLYHRAYSLPGK